MSTRNRNTTFAGLQWAATAFYLVAVLHGVVRHRGSDASDRRWAALYLGAMAGAFAAGRGRDGDPRVGVAVTTLLVAEYLVLRLLARGLAHPDEDSRHYYLVGAGVEALALCLAHGLARSEPVLRLVDKTQ